MATRALIGIIQTDAAGNQILTSTYNHYDGYPDSLGKGLNMHYDSADEAIEVANTGYISYLNAETGEIESKHKQAPEKNNLPDDFEEAMYELHSIADSYGADWVHIYAFDDADWVSARNASKALINKFESTSIYDQFDNYSSGEENDLADEETIQNMEENYKEKWDNFITENQAIDDQWTSYVKSLVNDIRLNGADSYTEYTEDDFKEDFENYVADKGGM